METVGFEPTTPCLQSRCSPTELRPRGRGCQQLLQRKATRHRLRDTALRGSAAQVASLPLRGIEFQLRGNSMVGQGGLEPPTPRLSSVCSNQLSYWPRSCGVAQSGEGCAVGARRGSHHDQARRQGRYVSNNQETSVRGCLPSRFHPEPFGQARTKRCLVMSDATQGSRKTRQADILERR